MNGKPIGVRRRVQYLVILALLAWATQTLLQQWGFGADAGAADSTGAADVVDAGRDPARRERL